MPRFILLNKNSIKNTKIPVENIFFLNIYHTFLFNFPQSQPQFIFKKYIFMLFKETFLLGNLYFCLENEFHSEIYVQMIIWESNWTYLLQIESGMSG